MSKLKSFTIIINIVLIFLISIFRKGIYKSLIIAVSAPIILGTILLSIPSISSLEGAILYRDVREKSIILTHSNVVRYCFPVSIYGFTKIGDIELPIITTPMHIQVEEFLGIKRVLEDCEEPISIPISIYKEMGDIKNININNIERCISYIHKNINAVIIFINNTASSESMLCIVNKSDVFKNVFSYLETEVSKLTLIWLAILMIVHIPLEYIALSNMYKNLNEELIVFRNLGIDKKIAVLSITITVLTLCFTITLFLLSISVVCLNALHKVFNFYWISPQPFTKAVALLIMLNIMLISIVLSTLMGLKNAGNP